MTSSHHDHDHDDGHHDHGHSHAHGHSHGHGSDQIFGRALLITFGFALVEAGVGWWANSLALMGDAGHMVADAGALGLAAVAARIARRPSSHRHSWGMGRAEVVSAAFNSLLMLAIVAGIVYSAIERLHTPAAVNSEAVMLVAGIGFALNILLLRTLSHGHQTLNVRGAVLHVIGDLLGSLAALASGVVIWQTGWMPIDPILSIAICVLILLSSVRIIRDVLHIIMEGVPLHLDLQTVGDAMAHTPGVCSVHDLHIWQLHSDQVALSAHVVLRNMNDWLPVLDSLKKSLASDFRIEHVTLQPELMTEVRVPMPKIGAGRT